MGYQDLFKNMAKEVLAAEGWPNGGKPEMEWFNRGVTFMSATMALMFISDNDTDVMNGFATSAAIAASRDHKAIAKRLLEYAEMNSEALDNMNMADIKAGISQFRAEVEKYKRDNES